MATMRLSSLAWVSLLLCPFAALPKVQLALAESEDVYYANLVPDGFPELSEAVLLNALQDDGPDADERRVWLHGNDSAPEAPDGAYGSHGAERPRAAGSPVSCHRPCGEDGDTPMVCYYRWRVEAYFTMGRPCGDCPKNVADCTKPQCVTADGFERGVLVVNRMLPGPSVHVCKGDIIVVDVKNMMPGRTTTLHWHGIRQRDSPFMDGVPMVTQCPIPEGAIYRYRFRADPIGTQFWHSHDGLQKMDGIVGSLVVRGPARLDPNRHLYDYDLRSHTMLITDWFHTDADQRFPGLMRRESGQLPDSYLINGRGSFRRARTDARLLFSMTLESETPYAVFRVTRGLRYRLRIVGGTCASCQFSVTVQDHRLKLIAVDVTPVAPVEVDSITMSAGERFDVVLEANQPAAAYWIHVRGLGACKLLGADQVAVLRYSDSPQALPATPRPTRLGLPSGVNLNPENSVCNDDNPDEVCVHHLRSLRQSSLAIRDMPVNVRIPLEFGFYFFSDNELFRSGTFQRFFNPPLFPPAASRVNNISLTMPPSPLLSQWDDIPPHLFCTPELLRTCQPRGLCECLHLVQVPLGEVVEFIIADSTRLRNGLSHPFHIHGHYFHILTLDVFKKGQTIDDISRLLDSGEIPFSERPVEKDTIAVPSGGYAVVRMVADNPGFWLMHCHFVYHVTAGMGLVIQVGERGDSTPVPSNFPRCGDFF